MPIIAKDSSRVEIPKLPCVYKNLEPVQRIAVRAEYAKRQNGKCHFCDGELKARPPQRIYDDYSINWSLFPGGAEGFLRYPHHLHHDHVTGLTIGVVHSICNAVLWEYYGE